MAQVRLDDISKRYDNGFEAVKKLSLDIADGEFVVLLGPSGCGKSTTLRMIAGLEVITSGDLFFGDQCITNLPSKDRDVGMVFQNYALYPHLTVFDNIAFPLAIRREKKSEIAARVGEVAATLELTPLLERKPKQLSGGQRQRVALGRALIRQPRVFLFDEPLSNLDASLRVQMRTEILNLQRQVNTTSVYVTHDQTEAMTMGDRIVIMHHGEVQQVGTPERIYNEPVNRFVAGFLGSPSMNFFNGRLGEGQGLTFVEEGRGIQVELPREAFTRDRLPSPGAPLTMGVRPEHVLPSRADNEPAEPSFTAPVHLVEYLGHELLLHFRTGANAKVCRLNSVGAGFQEGAVYCWCLQAEHIYLFDKDGQRC